MKTSRITGLLAVLALTLLSIGCASGGGGAAAAAVPPAPVIPAAVGSWTMTIDTPAGTQEPSLTIAGTEGALSGSFGSPAGDIDLSTVSFADGDIEFSVTIDIGGQELTLNFSGTVDGDSMTGSFASDFGDFAATAVRNSSEE